MTKLTPRQVHLDFHTSPLISGIGSNFSKENFQQALKLGHLTSITVFAKCHHSQCYYPTKIGKMHPGLDFDLLGAQIEAAHEIGVKAPVYITAGWSAEDALYHPEWHTKNKHGGTEVRNFDLNANQDDEKPNCSWINLCLNDNSYCQYIYDITKEICERYPKLDGLFFDICFNDEVCYCDECIKGMKEMGFDPDNDKEARDYFIIKHQTFMNKCREILDTNNQDASLFFNSGGADPYRPQFHCGSTHFELEDLPTAWGGYDKMPPTAKYFANTKKDYMGMTGKFHTEWGEFGGFKTGEALKFEAAAMLSYGARCSVGDQVHPDGMMDLDTYRNIGTAYEYVEKIEEYCLDGTQTTRLGLYLSDDQLSDEGAEKLLLETQNDFDIVYNNNFKPFDIVLFPDKVKLSNIAKTLLDEYVENGGKVIFTGTSLIEDDFILDVGAEFLGLSDYKNDYLQVGDKISQNMVTSPLLCYGSTPKLKVTDGEVLANALPPYFNRTYGKYCSHRNTPYNREKSYPAAVRKGNIVYIGHEICKMYKEYGSVYHKRFFENCLNLLNSEKVLSVSMPSAGRVSMIKQEDKNRYCLNMLYASPIKRGCIEVIEDIPPIYNIDISVKIHDIPKKIFSPADGQCYEFNYNNGILTFTVDKLQCHRLIVIEY